MHFIVVNQIETSSFLSPGGGGYFPCPMVIELVHGPSALSSGIEGNVDVPFPSRRT